MKLQSLNRNWMGLLFLSVLFVFSGCKRNAPTPTSEIYFKKTSCFGTCPIFTMIIKGDGEAIFNGERFTEKIGEHKKQLTKSEVVAIFNQLSELDWNEIKPIYPTDISDLPSTVIAFKHRKIDRKVVFSGEHPEELDVIESALSKIAMSENWIEMHTD